MKKYNEFGKNLLWALSENCITQKGIADKLGTTQQTISRWIKSNTEPSIDDILKLCYYLKTTPNELLGWEDIDINVFEKWLEEYENSYERIEHIKTQEYFDNIEEIPDIRKNK